MVAILKNIWETSATESYRPVSLLFMVNKFFEKLVNNMLVDHLEKFGFFLISSMVSGLLIQPRILTVQLLTVVSDKIVRGFNRSDATQTVALNI